MRKFSHAEWHVFSGVSCSWAKEHTERNRERVRAKRIITFYSLCNSTDLQNNARKYNNYRVCYSTLTMMCSRYIKLDKQQFIFLLLFFVYHFCSFLFRNHSYHHIPCNDLSRTNTHTHTVAQSDRWHVRLLIPPSDSQIFSNATFIWRMMSKWC